MITQDANKKAGSWVIFLDANFQNDFKIQKSSFPKIQGFSDFEG